MCRISRRFAMRRAWRWRSLRRDRAQGGAHVGRDVAARRSRGSTAGSASPVEATSGARIRISARNGLAPNARTSSSSMRGSERKWEKTAARARLARTKRSRRIQALVGIGGAGERGEELGEDLRESLAREGILGHRLEVAVRRRGVADPEAGKDGLDLGRLERGARRRSRTSRAVMSDRLSDEAHRGSLARRRRLEAPAEAQDALQERVRIRCRRGRADAAKSSSRASWGLGFASSTADGGPSRRRSTLA